MFSCTRSCILVKTKVDIKNFVVLNKLIKGLTAKYIAKKAVIFPSKEMKKSFNEMINDNNEIKLADKLAIVLFILWAIALK